ncbi:uncharacterized protein LOC132869030 [Neoarius graeffei]|uniref:uncharacterized protein LOC132869030 n=1 Tax=Neoarius graeffei TaxID=443677 RepID=UPI00298D1AEB|nr:uncharacterized protein LOC132869030 [Neoarius graeffei]
MDEDKLEELRQHLVHEMKKAHPNTAIVKKYMDLTFALRRKEAVHDKPPIAQILQRWPALFTESQICNEFNRVVGKNLSIIFLQALDQISPHMIEIFKKKTGTIGQKLNQLVQETKSTNLLVLQSSAMLSFAEDFPAITHHAEMPAVHPFQEFSPEDTRDTARQALKDVALQKLLAMVTELSSEVRELRKEVQEFRQSCRCCQPVRGVGQQVAQADMLELPLRSIDAFECAEDVLQTSEACKALVTRLAVVGGNNLESRVRRILSLLLTNEVASGLNWAGKRPKEDGRQKRAFRDTRLCKCIYDALTQQPGMNDLVFTQAVQKWLRYAPDRTGGVARAERHEN